MRTQDCKNVSAVFGCALLWRIFDPEMKTSVPDFMKNRVMTAYRNLRSNRLATDENPVEKVPLMVTGDDAQVFIEILLNDNDEGNGEGK